MHVFASKDNTIQVVPGRAGGGSFRRKKNYIAKKEFAYRMCARRPTSAMPKPFLCCERAFCCSMVVMWPVLMHVMSFDAAVMSRDAMRCHVTCAHVMCPAMVTLCVRSGSVTMWWSKVLFCTTKYYSSTTLYYTILQRTTPVLLCTRKYYSSTTLYYKVLLQSYKVLLQYYTVLQRTTPVLLCATKYYSSTTLYCKVLLQYYSVLQSTTPVLLCTTKYYSSTTLYYTVLQRTTPVLLCTTKYYSVLQSTTLCSTTLYCIVLLQYYSVLHSTTTYYSSTTLYYKAAFMIDPWHIWTVIYMIDVRRIWNVIYNARSNRSHPPTLPNTAPATQNDCDDWSAWHMKRHLQCAQQQESQSNFTKYCACHAKCISWLIRVTYETSFRMRGASKVNLEPHQILRLPRKMNLMIDPRHTWNVIYNARSKRSQPPTSPNTAPATKSVSSTLQRKLRELLPPIERRGIIRG